MRLEQCVPLSCAWISRHLQAHQWSVLQIQPQSLRPQALIELFYYVTSRIERDLFHQQGRLPMDHLYRPRQTLPQYSCTQNVVTIDHALKGLDELLKSLLRGYTEQLRPDVRVPTLLTQEMMEENAFLQRRQRIDILNVGSTSRCCPHNLRDLLGVQIYEG
jgi:hypothetical protein